MKARLRDDSASVILLLIAGGALAGVVTVIFMLEPTSWMGRLVFYCLLVLLLIGALGVAFLATTPLTRPQVSRRRKIVVKKDGHRTTESTGFLREIGIPLKRACLWASAITGLAALHIEQQLSIWNIVVILGVWIAFDLFIRSTPTRKAR